MNRSHRGLAVFFCALFAAAPSWALRNSLEEAFGNGLSLVHSGVTKAAEGSLLFVQDEPVQHFHVEKPEITQTSPGEGLDGKFVLKRYELPSFETSNFIQRPDIKHYYETVIRKRYEAAVEITDIEAMEYLSDGLKIPAFLLRPKDVQVGARLPILIFNRPGNGNIGTLGIKNLLWLSKFSQKGYVVLASQYRGSSAEADGDDEFGGRDVHDILNLIKVAKSLPYADSRRIFMVGVSRGGMETYIVLKADVDHEIRAAAVLVGICDLKVWLKSRPEMKRVFQRMIPNYKKNREKELADRSACSWPQDINAPIYIFGDSVDLHVPTEQAGRMAQALGQLGKPYKLEIHPGSHGIWFSDQYSDEIIGKIDGWFQAH